MTENLLTIKNLRLKFYTWRGVVNALNGINLDINKNETLGLVGESGCGKSVTAFSILRLIKYPGKIEEGEIWFEDRNLLKLSEKELRKIRGRKISFIFQEPTTALNPVITSGDQTSEVLKIHYNMRKRDMEKEVLNTFELVGLPDPEMIKKKYPHELSGGMKQRIMITMALLCKPKLLIADEPTSNLDVTIQAQILELMNKLKKNMKTSILFITHNLGIAAEMSDRIAVMYAGKVVEKGDVKKIFQKPSHPYTQGLLASLPLRGKKRLRTIPGFVPNLIDDIPSGCIFHPRCKFVQNICKKKEPMRKIISSNHYVYCHIA